MVHNFYPLFKFILKLVCLLPEVTTALTIMSSAILRNSPIMVNTCLALCLNCVKDSVVFFGHDFPTGLAGKEEMGPKRSCFVLVTMICWWAQLLNLLAMTANFTILTHSPQFYRKRIVRARFGIVALTLLLAVAIALPCLDEIAHGLRFHIDTMNWSRDQSKTIPTVLVIISMSFQIALGFTILIAGVNMCIRRRRIRKVAGVSWASPKAHGDVKLIAAFVAVSFSYAFTSFLVNFAGSWQSNVLLVQALEILDDVIDGTKWVLYARSSADFRRVFKANRRCLLG